jgi:carboxypeptidase C (cathepsin A)
MLRSLLVVLMLASPVLAQAGGGGGEAESPGAGRKAPTWPSASESDHQVLIGGRNIAYTATAGTLELPDYEQKPKAHVFYTAYVLHRAESADALSPRPLTFVFNGGPGSSSVWLHLGALGPRRVDFADEREGAGAPALPLPPYRTIPNEHSWLDLTDLVFIDPVGTGYSRPVEGEKKEQFHGLREDIQWVGDFIRLWTTRNQRWDSPIYLAGESYGTTRAAGLAGYLQDTHGMYLSGIALISPVLNFQTVRFDEGNDTPYWLYLPTYTATAWYHGKLGEDLQRDLGEALAQSESFAQGDYLVALARGDALTPAQEDHIAGQLSRLTGLSEEFIRNSRLRIHISEFCKELLRDREGGGRSVGRLDSRYTGIDRRGTSDRPDYDASYAAIQGPFTAALNHYMRAELGYSNDLPYEILTGRVHPWSYASESNRYADVGGTLRSAMSKNRALRVLVACGYYDLATPYFAADYTVRHLGLDPELRRNITIAYYRSGHMMYIRHADLAKLKEDAAALFEGR